MDPFRPQIRTVDINYHPTENQSKLDSLMDINKITMGVCGRRFGKSYIAIARCIREAFTKPTSVPKDFVVLYVMKTEKQGETVTWDRFMNMIPKELLVSHDHGDMKIQIKNRYSDYPVTIYIRGCSEDSLSNIRGLGVYFLVLDEFFLVPVSTWENILRPMINHPLSRALLIGNIPDPKKEHIDERWNIFREICKSEANPDYGYIEFTSYDGYVSKDEIDRAITESELLGDGKNARREYLNILDVAEEYIWKKRFDHSKHVKYYTDLPPVSNLLFYNAIDPHVSGIVYTLYVGIDREERKWVYHEIKMEGVTIPYVAARMFEQERILGIDPLIRLIDPRTSILRNKLQNLPTIKEQFEQEGMGVYLGVSDFDGFKLAMDTDLDQNKIIFSSSCSGAIKEVFNHRWETRKSRLSLSDPKLKERDEYNHYVACLKYIYNTNPGWINRPAYRRPYDVYRDHL